MRRGRPTKTDSPPPPAATVSAVTEHTNVTPSQAKAKFESNVPTTSNSTKYDPFDPSHVRSSQNKTSTPPPAAPSPVSSNATPVGFQNSFTPGENNVGSSSPPARVQSVPLVTPKPQLATKILQTQPNSPVKPERTFSSSSSKPTSSDKEEKKTEEKVEDDEEEEDEDEGLPKMNRGVSSSIEARFMAIKNASRNSQPIHHHNKAGPVPTSSTSSASVGSAGTAAKKNKPAPPPKPARFRSNATTTANVPSVDDFENKFPSLEDLDKSISS